MNEHKVKIFSFNTEENEIEAEINIKYQGNEYDTKDMILASIL